MPPDRPTALASAHARFREGLPRRGSELIAIMERATQASARDQATSAADELGRRVHALYASAEVFHEEELTTAAREVARVIDQAREQKRQLGPTEAQAVTTLAASLGAPGAQQKLAAAQPPKPVDVRSTTAGMISSPDVIAVLVVARREVEEAVRAALPVDRCELTTSREVEVAIDVVDRVSPDIVLIEAELLGRNALGDIEALRGDRRAAQRAVAIVVQGPADDEQLLTQTRADAVLHTPLSPTSLLERLHRIVLGEPARKPLLEGIRGGTVEEIAASVAEQVRRGLIDSIRSGRGERIDLGDQAELLAATWSAVSRIRAHLADRAHGRVRFELRPQGGPATLALTDAQSADPYVALDDSLRGRRIVIADDDPAVVWFFGNLLREAGAVVIEAKDGRQALELTRKRAPDLVISDILMPGVDGFALCRELRRDFAVSYLPVILISWKEDFLQRMRELDAGAAGYLRKEAGSHQILTTVVQTLAPRAELEAMLATGSEVRGRIDQLGTERLLRTVAARAPNARISVRDAFNLFEVDVRDGITLDVTRTAADGTFARGALALRQLVGVSAGRFTVHATQGPVRHAMPEPLDKSVGDAVLDLGALLDAVSDSYLLRIERVEIDDEVLRALLAVTPTELADVAEHLRSGEPVSRLVLSGRWSARELEEHLRELTRRGAITAVRGSRDEDLALEARHARERNPGALLHASASVRRSSLPPTEVDEREVDWITPANAAASSEVTEAEEVDDEYARALEARSKRARAIRVPDHASDGSAAAPVQLRPSQALPRSSSHAAFSEAQASVRSVPPPIVISSPAQLDAQVDALFDATPSAEALRAPRVPSAAPSSAPPAAAGFAVRSKLLDDPAVAAARAQSSRPPQPSQPPPVQPAAPSGTGTVRFVWVLMLLSVLSYSIWSMLRPVVRPADDGEEVPAEPAAAAGPAEPATPDAPEPPAPAQPTKPPAQDGVDFGRVLPFIDRSRGVDVGEGQGLLVVESEGSGTPPRVRIAGVDRGPTPLAIALEAGRHELAIVRGSETSLRYLVIRAGETRVVQVSQ